MKHGKLRRQGKKLGKIFKKTPPRSRCLTSIKKSRSLKIDLEKALSRSCGCGRTEKKKERLKRERSFEKCRYEKAQSRVVRRRPTALEREREKRAMKSKVHGKRRRVAAAARVWILEGGKIFVQEDMHNAQELMLQKGPGFEVWGNFWYNSFNTRMNEYRLTPRFLIGWIMLYF